MAQFVSSLLDLLFPPRCIYCGQITKSEHKSTCPKCAKALPLLSKDTALRRGQAFSFCVSAFQYKDPFRHAFLQYKFYGKRRYGDIFTPHLSNFVEMHLTGKIDCITWIPVSAVTLKKRGFDQSRLIAEQLGKSLNFPVVPLLTKARHITPQSQMPDAKSRRENVKNTFSLSNPNAVKGMRLLLVDDILTTGETLEEAARTLQEASPACIFAATLARGDMV